MPISIDPIFPVIAAQGASPDVVLQPGTVIDAQVLRILANDLVRIAIANLSIEVFSEIPLQVGQALQLAVSQTSDGVRLAVVGQGAAPSTSQAAGKTVAPNVASPDLLFAAPEATIDAAAKPAAETAPLKNPLTPLQALAVSAAAQTAAARQGSLAPLFANLGAIAASNGYPATLQQAAVQLLALRPNLDQNLTGNDIEAAFKSSGLFLESSFAAETAALPSPADMPDLKAALIVLRQTLLSFGTAANSESGSAPAPAFQPPSARVAPPVSDIAAADTDTGPAAPVAAAPTLAPSLMPDVDIEEVFLPQARLPVADELVELNETSSLFSAPTGLRNAEAGPHAAATGAILTLLQEMLQAIPQKMDNPPKPMSENDALNPLPSVNQPRSSPLHDEVAAVRATAPSPPFRGALPSAQPIMPPSLAPDAPLASAVHHLLDETDAALARQTLLQVASLPDRADIAGPRTDPAAPRWNFEIPFATPAGTATAQFEISRDGGANEVAAAKRAWRARFSLDVEPAGPVHALILLSGDRTSVRMWAERPATAAQLRAGALQLGQALSRAELQPGDIVIRDGAPTQSAPAPAGHFLDRAL